MIASLWDLKLEVLKGDCLYGYYHDSFPMGFETWVH